jgi:ABC-2 type transport system ATP-binding protein
MDEAERCHRLAFIAGGKLLTRGDTNDVVRDAGLITWAVSGPRVVQLAKELRQRPGVRQAVEFGTQLHVSGVDEAALENAIAPFRTGEYTWERVRSGLEDVFIHLMDVNDKG